MARIQPTINDSRRTHELDAWLLDAVAGRSGRAAALSTNAPFQVIFKIQETCNLNCSYCYMYNKGNDLYRNVPSSSPLDVCASVGRLIAEEFRTREPCYAQLILHGGEPMLMPPHRFRERICRILDEFEAHDPRADRRRLSISLQTNATLVTDKWIDLLEEFSIGVGVTVDGPREVHDVSRVDKRGRGSYDRVREGVDMLHAAVRAGKIKDVTCLTVINPDLDGAVAYSHIVDELGFSFLDFLLPFENWSSFDPTRIDAYSRFLTAAFRKWVEKEDKARVRIFERAVRDVLRVQHQRNPVARSPEADIDHYYFVVESDGSVMPDETVRVLVDTRFSDLNVASATLSDIIADHRFQALIQAERVVPPECGSCALREICGCGCSLGRLGSRFSGESGFRQRSVFCSVFIDLYAEAVRSVGAVSGRPVRIEEELLAFH